MQFKFGEAVRDWEGHRRVDFIIVLAEELECRERRVSGIEAGLRNVKDLLV
jgi:hypothetical protein